MSGLSLVPRMRSPRLAFFPRPFEYGAVYRASSRLLHFDIPGWCCSHAPVEGCPSFESVIQPCVHSTTQPRDSHKLYVNPLINTNINFELVLFRAVAIQQLFAGNNGGYT